MIERLKMKISNIDLDKQVLIIAEIGNCHEGNLALAEELICLAAKSGADAVKFQTIVPERLVSLRLNERILQLKRFQLSYAEFEKLSRTAEKENVLFLSTPFDIESALFLDGLVPAFKIASGDNTFFPLLKVVARTGKPILLSSGLVDLQEINQIKNFIESIWRENEISQEMVILHCVSGYPVPAKEANLSAIRLLMQSNVTVGYSDHTLGIEAAVLSVALGARVVEKHFTISKAYSDFHDHRLAADPAEMAQMVQRIREAETMLGDGQKILQPCEKHTFLGARRSIVARRLLKRDNIITLDDLTWVRPGGGMEPGREGEIVNKTLKRDIWPGEMISLDDVF